MSDLHLFNDPALKPGARTGDPETSHEAANAVTPRAQTKVHAAILAVLRDYGPSTDEDIALLVEAHHPGAFTSPSGLRTRRSELLHMGLIEDSGHRGLTRRGRRTAIWQLVTTDEDVPQRDSHGRPNNI